MKKEIFIKYSLSFILCFISIKILQCINQYNFLSFITGVIIEGIYFIIYDKLKESD